MQPIKIPPYIRSGNIDLARWQSAVAAAVRKNIVSKNADGCLHDINNETMQHAMVQGTNLHVARHTADAPLMTEAEAQKFLTAENIDINLAPELQSYLSQYYFAMVQDPERGDISNIKKPYFFPESDFAYTHWGLAMIEWELYANPENSPYIDWKAAGKDINTFGVVEIDEHAKIAIIGDFGTGLNDATMFLMAIIKEQNPDIIIHLGDIYYTGTQHECELYTQTFAAAFAAVFPGTGKTIPVYSIPGNHEYYTGGGPFFKQVLPMNPKQEASYFCLQTANKNWQLLAMDTGYNSLHTKTGLAAVLTVAYAPWLQFNEAGWHVNKMENFAGKTILLSHHQLFSASSLINDGTDVAYMSKMTEAEKIALNYLNGNLNAVFSPYYNKVAAWFWGHEHILGIYDDPRGGPVKGRLIGDSGYEESDGQDPYKTKDSPYTYFGHDEKPALPPIRPGTSSVKWNGTSFEFINHSCAIVKLQGSAATVNYYQYPVFAPDASIAAIGDLQPLTKIDFEDTL